MNNKIYIVDFGYNDCGWVSVKKSYHKTKQGAIDAREHMINEWMSNRPGSTRYEMSKWGIAVEGEYGWQLNCDGYMSREVFIETAELYD